MSRRNDVEMVSKSTSNPSKRESGDLSGSVFLIGENGIIPLPMPSRSSRDPLNWCMRKRVMAIVANAWFAVVGLVLIQSAGLMYGGLIAEFSASEMAPFSVDILVSGPTLFMGIGPFFWVPLSLAVGRRPAFLLATIIMTFGTVWAAITKDFHQLLAALCVTGFAEGFASSNGLLIVIDLTFIHQRPQVLAAMWGGIGFVSSSVFSIVPEMSSNGANRHMFYIIWVLPCCISFLLAYFFYPETYFVRPALAFNGRVLVQSSTEKAQVYDSWDETGSFKELPDIPDKSRWIFSRQEYRIWGKTPHGWTACWNCYPQILLCFLNPLIFWVALLEALVFGSMLAIGSTFPVTLTAAPYNLSVSNAALVNLAGAFGALLSWPISGCLIVHITTKLAMHNKGVREAEHYLPAFILPVIFAALSLFLYGTTIHLSLPAALVYVSYFMNSFAFSSLATANTLWVTEAFPRWAAPAIVVTNGASYMASFGTSFVIYPWIQNQGILGMQVELGMAIVGVGCVGLTWVFWGKRLRGLIEGRWAESEAGALRPR